MESFIPLSFIPSVFISASLFIILQADYFISKAGIMNNVSFLSSFFPGLFALCDLAFGPVADWGAIFGPRQEDGGMRDGKSEGGRQKGKIGSRHPTAVFAARSSDGCLISGFLQKFTLYAFLMYINCEILTDLRLQWN